MRTCRKGHTLSDPPIEYTNPKTGRSYRVCPLCRENSTEAYKTRNAGKTRGKGIQRLRPGRFIKPEEKDAILAMYEAKARSKDIAALYQVNVGTISKIIRELGGTVRPIGSPHQGNSYIDKNGYCWVSPGKPFEFPEMMYGNGFILEHRLVMARKLGRALVAQESVHHINGNRLDNRPENLQLRQGAHGRGISLCCLDCGSQRISPKPL